MAHDLIVSAAHLLFAILATFRLTELVTMDRLAAPFRARFPHYLWTCGRCVSVWAGVATTLIFVGAPWLNWPLGLSYLLIVRWDWRAAAHAWREARLERAVTRALRPIAGGSVGPPMVAPLTVFPTNGQPGDIQAKINATTSDTDIVTIPAGDFTWTSAGVVLSSNCTLQGAGIGQTIVRSAGAMSNMLHINAPGKARCTGISFIQQVANNSPNSEVGVVQVDTASSQIRFDHCEIVLNNGNVLSGFTVHRNGGGVADHNVLTYQGVSGSMTGVFDGSTGGSVGDESWAAPDDMGNANGGAAGAHTWYVENNTYNNLTGTFGMTDGSRGGRVVYRYNTFNNLAIGDHGTDSNHRPRSMRLIEAYENDFNWTTVNGADSVIQRRGGTGVVFNNRIHVRGVTQPNNFVKPVTFRSPIETSTPLTPSPWGPCMRNRIASLTNNGRTATATTGPREHYMFKGGETQWVRVTGASDPAFNGNFTVDSTPGGFTFTYTMATTPSGPSNCGGPANCEQSSPWDQNSLSDGYACLDMAGMGQSDRIFDVPAFSGNPSLSATVPNVAGWPNQQSSPIYCWGNTIDFVQGGPTTAKDCAGLTIAVTGRDIINGVKPGYAPYPYPHPLISGTGGPTERGPIAGVPGAYSILGAVPGLARIANLIRLRYRRP